jgi:GNAT superfamily N-acetyltransferase
MSFEIKIFDGEFFYESDEDAFDFRAKLYHDEDDPKNDLTDEEVLATSSGAIVQGTADGLYWISDVNSSTHVEGYIRFLEFLSDAEIHEYPADFFKVMIIRDLNAKTIGKGFGTKLLTHLKSYALATGLDHIALIADSKSEVDLDKYYEKVGFFKLPHDNWLFAVNGEDNKYIARNLALFREEYGPEF